jgi:hypothetical protein
LDNGNVFVLFVVLNVYFGAFLLNFIRTAVILNLSLTLTLQRLQRERGANVGGVLRETTFKGRKKKLCSSDFDGSQAVPLFLLVEVSLRKGKAL